MRTVVVALLLCLATNVAHAGVPEITLSIGGQRLIAEVASSDTERKQGLMYRRILPDNRGMLFVFPETTLLGLWMMDTYVPLSVAFIDEEGLVMNIEEMQPRTQDVHKSAKPAKYALEANLGWFKKYGIKAGARVEGLQQVPLPR